MTIILPSCIGCCIRNIQYWNQYNYITIKKNSVHLTRKGISKISKLFFHKTGFHSRFTSLRGGIIKEIFETLRNLSVTFHAWYIHDIAVKKHVIWFGSITYCIWHANTFLHVWILRHVMAFEEIVLQFF